MQKYFSLFRIFSLFMFAGLTACEDDEVIVPAKNELVAIAGEDQTAPVNTSVLLDGSPSFDKNQKPFTYSWSVKSKPAGSLAVPATPQQDKTSFTPDVAGVYLIELTIKQNTWTAVDHVIITATAGQPNDPTTIILNQDINAATTLANVMTDPSVPDYIITADIKVRADLTIEPGVVIYFNDHAALHIIEGTFRAIGTPSNKIILEGFGDSQGYWRGIVVYSNSEENEIRHVSVLEAGSMAFYETQTQAAITLAGTDYSGAALKLSHTSIEKSGGYGLFVQGKSLLNTFGDNAFVQNAQAAAYVPVHQLHKLDGNTTFTGNGFNGVATSGSIQNENAVEWKKLANGSYLVENNIVIQSGVSIEPGASFKAKPQTTIEISGNGYLNATGTANAKIVFTSSNTAEYWNGLFFDSPATLNRLHYTEVSYAGFSRIGEANYEANITVGTGGKVSVLNSEIAFGRGYGLVAKSKDQVNGDVSTVNSFHNLAKGIVFPKALQYPDLPSLEGEWMDQWSFFNGKTGIALNFYNPATQSWYGGASSPWIMNAGKGMGLHIAEDKSYTWAIAEHSPWSGCESYSTEYITGSMTWTDETIEFTEDFWRTRFINSCDPSQNVDMEVTPGGMTLRYQINKLYNFITGEEYWELKFFNPDNTTFSLYRR